MYYHTHTRNNIQFDAIRSRVGCQSYMLPHIPPHLLSTPVAQSLASHVVLGNTSMSFTVFRLEHQYLIRFLFVLHYMTVALEKVQEV